jgi:hypothetical protein
LALIRYGLPVAIAALDKNRSEPLLLRHSITGFIAASEVGVNGSHHVKVERPSRSEKRR